MRRLMLLRHAKALPGKGGKDINRPLSDEGREEAHAVGQYMATEGLETNLALISPSVRTRETFDLVDIFLTSSPKMRVEPAMYEASWVSLFALIRKAPAKQPSLLLVGHNPGFEDLANELIGSGNKTALSHFPRRMATGALAVIDFDTKGWNRIKARGGHLSFFVAPDDLFALKK